MSRPKKGTPEGELASRRWRETMIRRYGSPSKKMAEVGRIGGQNGRGPDYRGGFAANIEIARLAGMKGGKISRRKSKFDKELRASLPVIKKFLVEKELGRSVKELSRELNIPYVTLAHYIRKIKK